MTKMIPEEYPPCTRSEVLSEDDVPATYLLIGAATDVTSVTVIVADDEIGALSEPGHVQTGVANDGWTIDEVFDSISDDMQTRWVDGRAIRPLDNIVRCYQTQ